MGVYLVKRYPRRVPHQPSDPAMTEHTCTHHASKHGHEPAGADGRVKDPVCGMMVNPETAKHRHTHDGQEYVFCGRGCKLDFDEDPERYLDPEYVPSM